MDKLSKKRVNVNNTSDMVAYRAHLGIDALLRYPSKTGFSGSISASTIGGITYEQAVVGFMQDSEWNWRSGHPPLADW